MDRRNAVIVGKGRLILWGIALLAIYPLSVYTAADKERDRRAAINPVVDEEVVREIGYISETRSTLNWSLREFEIMFWVKIPITGAEFSCAYQAGPFDLDRDEPVYFTHDQELPKDGDGGVWLIPIHEPKAKPTYCHAINMLDVYLG